MDGLPTDRVYEAYYGAMGEYLSVATRERIHWLCERATGSHVLDVGCSQGIASLILGREGKIIDGIDIDKKSISFARDKLLIETPEVQERIHYIEGDFLNSNLEPRAYDTVIISEILEHLINPQSIIDKVKEVLVPSGRLLISVPFGINDAVDHKKTYYGTKLAGTLISNGFIISDKTVIKNAWLCYSCDFSEKETNNPFNQLIKILDWLEFNIQERERKINSEKSSIAIKLQENQDYLKRQRELENNFQLVVRDLTQLNGKSEDGLRKSHSMILELTSKIKDVEIKNAELNTSVRSQLKENEELKKGNSLLVKDNEDLLTKLRDANQKYSNGMQSYVKLKQENADVLIDKNRAIADLEAYKKDKADLLTKLREANQKYSQGMQSYEKLKQENSDLLTKLRDANQKYSQGMQSYEKLKQENSDLLTKLRDANQKYSNGMQSYEKLKQESEDLIKSNKILIERMNKEMLEERRILDEYSRLQKDRDKLFKKWNGFINSKTGKIVNSIWKIYNKILYN